MMNKMTLIALIGATSAQDDFYYGEYAAVPFDGYFDLDSQVYVYLETYDPNFTYFYYYDSDGEICYIESILGADGLISEMVITDPWALCPLVGQSGWGNIEFTLDDNGNLGSYVGPEGETWEIYDYDTLFAQPPPFKFDIYAAASYSGAFDFDNNYSLIETYDESLSWFYFYDSNGEICDLQTEFNDDGTLRGWNVFDTWGSCASVANGWTYAPIFYDGEGTSIDNVLYFEAPGGQKWYLYSYEEIFNSKDEDWLEEPIQFYGALPFEGSFDENGNTYTLFETYVSSLNWFYFYDSEGAICELKSVFTNEGTMLGFDVVDTWASCPYIE